MCVSRMMVLSVLFVSLLISSATAQSRSNLGSAGAAPEIGNYYQYPSSGIFRFLQMRQGPQKRNNAEVVNHILKNFGTLDRLGDVGK